MTRVIYLHGFASSPRSSKATYIGSRLTAQGVPFEAPDLNVPDFSTLTVSRMIGQVTTLIDAQPGRPVTLIGSSLGGFVSVQTALLRPQLVERMVLLAPALDFGGNRMRSLGDRGLEEWKTTDVLNVFHYAYGRLCPVHYELYADARRYNCLDATVQMPIQIFQGRRDDAVDPASVERWAAARPNVELQMLDDDHQLTASLPHIWKETARFLGLTAR